MWAELEFGGVFVEVPARNPGIDNCTAGNECSHGMSDYVE